MLRWLMHTTVGTPVLDALLAFHVTGSPLPAVLTLVVLMVRARLPRRRTR